MLDSGTQDELAQAFVQFSVESGVLRFGEFKTKAGRMSPYFFNAGLFDDGAKLGRLAAFYAKRIVGSGIEFDMIFGPAYKGIPLGAAVAIELARLGRNVPFAYNRKEAKDHGEGGTLVGAPLKGRVLIVDDVMSAGTAARESIALIQAAGATPEAARQSLARANQRRGINALQAVQQGRAYAIWHHYYNSPFNVVAVQVFAKWLHPELFADLDPRATLQTMFTQFQPIPLTGVYWTSL